MAPVRRERIDSPSSTGHASPLPPPRTIRQWRLSPCIHRTTLLVWHGSLLDVRYKPGPEALPSPKQRRLSHCSDPRTCLPLGLLVKQTLVLPPSNRIAQSFCTKMCGPDPPQASYPILSRARSRTRGGERVTAGWWRVCASRNNRQRTLPRAQSRLPPSCNFVSGSGNFRLSAYADYRLTRDYHFSFGADRVITCNIPKTPRSSHRGWSSMRGPIQKAHPSSPSKRAKNMLPLCLLDPLHSPISERNGPPDTTSTGKSSPAQENASSKPLSDSFFFFLFLEHSLLQASVTSLSSHSQRLPLFFRHYPSLWISPAMGSRFVCLLLWRPCADTCTLRRSDAQRLFPKRFVSIRVWRFHCCPHFL